RASDAPRTAPYISAASARLLERMPSGLDVPELAVEVGAVRPRGSDLAIDHAGSARFLLLQQRGEGAEEHGVLRRERRRIDGGGGDEIERNRCGHDAILPRRPRLSTSRMRRPACFG